MPSLHPDLPLLQDNAGRRYQLLGQLGQGGFGVVVHARALGEGGFAREVAIKLMNANLASQDEFARRFRDEARLLGFLQHRAIVSSLDLIRVGEAWAVVMEYVPGADLGALIEGVAMPCRPALEMAREVAGALAVAHGACDPGTGRALGLIHRDIKPANVRLTPAGEIKLLDFGVARASFDEREATTRSIAFGSPGYLAPERIEGTDQPASDLYSLGVVLYESLSGRRLGQLPLDARRHHRKVGGALRELSDALGHEPGRPEILALLEELLHYDADRRPTAAELHDGLPDLIGLAAGPWLSQWAGPAIAAARARTPAQRVQSTPPPTPAAPAPDSGWSIAWSSPAPTPAPARVSGPTPGPWASAPTPSGSTPGVTPRSAGPIVAWSAAPAAPPLEARPDLEPPGGRLRLAAVGMALGAAASVLALGGVGLWTWRARAEVSPEAAVAAVEVPVAAAVEPAVEAPQQEPAPVAPSSIFIGPLPPTEQGPTAEPAPSVTSPTGETNGKPKPRPPKGAVPEPPVESPEPTDPTETPDPPAPEPCPDGTVLDGTECRAPPAPPPISDEPGSLTVKGTFSAVSLVGPHGAWSDLSSIPPGTYQLHVTFNSDRTVYVGVLRIDPGEPRIVTCRQDLDRCQGAGLRPPSAAADAAEGASATTDDVLHHEDGTTP